MLDDPYVSRSHCTVEVYGTYAVVDASGSLNQIRVNGNDVEVATLASGDAWIVGHTTLRVVAADDRGCDTTLKLDARTTSTRELVGPNGMPLLQFSPSECLAFEVLARKFPDAASHAELGSHIWGGLGYDQYQLHRLMQRIRQRLGSNGEVLENVRGAGYHLSVAVVLA